MCRSYKIAFSFATIEGGYFHDDGSYTQEMTLVLTLIDVDKKIVDTIAGDLCAFFNQESVLVTEGEVKAYFVNEKI